MASTTSTTTQAQEIENLRNRMDWLDGERRKLNRKLAEMGQTVELQQREINKRERRIQELERQSANTSAQFARLPQIDTQLSQFKDDIVKMIEQYDKRRLQAEAELDRLRRVEHEVTARELSDIRKQINVIPQLQTNLDLRLSEESRLASLIGGIQNKITAVNSQLENIDSSFSFLQEKEKSSNRTVTELQTDITETNKRVEHIQPRIDALSATNMRYQGQINTIEEEQIAIRESTQTWMEQIQIGEYERNQRLDSWRRVIEEQGDVIDQFKKEWISISDQYKEAKMALQTMGGWQKQIEKQQRESSELLRVETHRMQARWDEFKLDSQKTQKNFEIDTEQKWLAANRHERELREQINQLEILLEQIEQEKQTLWRIQTAQADAIKQFPRIWLEQVEKAIEQDPNRRRQPALITVREE